ncbi:unnamed protein product [Thlaspi arvense]|uniref:Uncharacterized protein n=1 Tax=Thlaspi arvense TaxID=13288 RepID=A0AAU9RWA8_THLAR|nr:unnamed protein product [Thlaspi arvense]
MYVPKVIEAGAWSIRRQRGALPQELTDRIRAEPVPIEDMGEDLVMWTHKEDTYSDSFSSSLMWNQIRKTRDKRSKIDYQWGQNASVGGMSNRAYSVVIETRPAIMPALHLYSLVGSIKTLGWHSNLNSSI